MAKIEKDPRNNGRWRVRYRDYTYDGDTRRQPQTTKGGFKSKQEAELWVARMVTARSDGTWVDPSAGKMLMAEWIPVWMDTCWTHLRPSTRNRDRDYVKRYLVPVWGRWPLRDITRLDVQRWVNRLSESGLAAATVHKAFQLLSKALSEAEMQRLISRNVAAKVKLPRIEQKEMRFLTPLEVARLADAIDPRYRAAVLLGAYGGLRRGELFGLRRQYFNEALATVRVVETVVEVRSQFIFGPPKTKAGRREVPLPRFVAAAVAKHIETYADARTDLVFPGPGGGPAGAASFRSRTWVPAVKAANLHPLRMHDLRHTAVALWVAAGANGKELTTWVGHTRVAFTLDRYGHLYAGTERRVMDALDDMADPGPLPPPALTSPHTDEGTSHVIATARARSHVRVASNSIPPSMVIDL